MCSRQRLATLSAALVSLLALTAASLLLATAALSADRWMGQSPAVSGGSGSSYLSNSVRRLENRLGATLTIQNGVPFVWRPDKAVPIAESVGLFRTSFLFVRDVQFEVIYSLPTPRAADSCDTATDGQNRSQRYECTPLVGIIRNEWNFYAAVRNLFSNAISSSDYCPYIDLEKVCDGHPDCPSWSDESSCNRSAAVAATTGFCNDTCNDYPTLCGSAAGNATAGLSCSPLLRPSGDWNALSCTNYSALSAAAAGSARCDGVADCFDFSDEMSCDRPQSSLSQDGGGGDDKRFVVCANGQRIRDAARCDQLVDCRDGSDETGCEYRSELSAGVKQPAGARDPSFAAASSDRATFTHSAAGALEHRTRLFLAPPIVRDASTHFRSCLAGLALGVLSAVGAALALPSRLHVHMKLFVLLSCACGLATVACHAAALSGWARAVGDENSAVEARWLAVADAAAQAAGAARSSDGGWLRYEARALRYELRCSATLLAAAIALAALAAALQMLLICSLRWTAAIASDGGEDGGYFETANDAAHDSEGGTQSSVMCLSRLDGGEEGGRYDDDGDYDDYGGANELISQLPQPPPSLSSSLGRMSPQRKGGFY